MPNFQAINIPWIKLDANFKIPTQKKTDKQTNKQNKMLAKLLLPSKIPRSKISTLPQNILALIWKAEHEGGSFVS